ncbi:MAG: hypothetical protein AseanaTS_27650 [Candidatus Pelagadaptatus aseana]|uniref:hypothetical protein n=1 Tax=Candidatus Pelagadaptatus aseana TaxID=3120508 RepID=UPI0039B20CDA
MKKILTFLILISLTSQGLADTFKNTARYIAEEGAWPYIINDATGIYGVLPDSVYAIMASAGVEVYAQTAPNLRKISELFKQKADIATILLGYKDIAKSDYPPSMHLCPEPILMVDVHAVWHPDSNIDPHKTYNLDNFKVGVVKVSPKDLVTHRKDKRIEFINIELMVKNLLAKRVDAILMNGRHAQALAKRLGAKQDVVPGQRVLTMPIHLIVGKHWLNQTAALDHLCGQIVELKKNNTFTTIEDSYFQ